MKKGFEIKQKFSHMNKNNRSASAPTFFLGGDRQLLEIPMQQSKNNSINCEYQPSHKQHSIEAELDRAEENAQHGKSSNFSNS